MSKNNEALKPSNHAELVHKFRPYKGKFKYGIESIVTEHPRTDINAGLELYQDEWKDHQKLHLLKRTLFGVKQSDLNSLKSLSFQQTIEKLFEKADLISPPVNNYNNDSENVKDPVTPFGETWIESPFDEDFEGFKILSLKGWIIKNMVNSPVSLHHKITFFWHNLLVTQFWDVFQAKASYQYYKTLHENAFGNFKELIKKITKDPAMLIYLNGTRNNKEAPDENYARELQELFCVGKGPDSKYNEKDVQAAAKVLTGWVINYDSFINKGEATSFFYPDNHEINDKSFSSFYQNRIVAGKSGPEGEKELDELIDMIFDQPETALYICRRIYNFFVYNQIDESTEANVIQPLATAFRENNYEILPMLKTLFSSAHFHHQENQGVLIKNPLDFLMSIVRSLDLEIYEEGELSKEYAINNSLIYRAARIGLEIGDPPSVAGYPAYYQSPQFDKSWITTDSITKRAEMSDNITYALYANSELFYLTDLIKFIKTFSNPADPNELIKEANRLIAGIPFSEKSADNLKSILLAGQQEDYHWTLAWNDYLAQPENDELKSVVENRLRSTFRALMQLGEFHLM